MSVEREDFNELNGVVQDFGEAQGRTEQRLGKLVEAQVQINKKIDDLGHSLTNQIAALGGRWGIYDEGMFRSTIRGLMSKMSGVEVREGYYGDRQVDVLIRNGEHAILEITFRMHPKDIKKIYSSADDESAEDYLYPESYFVLLELPEKAREALMLRA